MILLPALIKRNFSIRSETLTNSLIYLAAFLTQTVCLNDTTVKFEVRSLTLITQEKQLINLF
jgi:hypothetical protein